MSFFDDIKDIGKDILGTAGNMFGGSIGGAAATSLGNSIFGSDSETGVNFEDVRRGHFEDRRDYRLRDKYDWRKAQQRGLTAQEFYGSAAAGGSGSSGGAQVLGNAQSEREQLNDQLGQQAAIQGQQVAAQLAQTKMQTDAQIESSKIQAGATQGAAQTGADASRYAADIQKAIADQNYNLAVRKLEEVDLVLLEADINLKQGQLKVIQNEIATSDPKFVTYMKQLSMGVDNMLVEFLQAKHGFKITDHQSIRRMSERQRKEFIKDTMALQSHLAKEAAGLALAGSGVLGDLSLINQTAGIESIYDTYKSVVNYFGGGNAGQKALPSQPMGQSKSRFPSHHRNE